MKTISTKRTILIRAIRLFRKIHRTLGVALFAFFFKVATTGLLLGWKKHSNGLILPKSYKGVSTDLRTWLPIDSLHAIAVGVLHDSISNGLKTDLERIDIRP
jgi:hypothetical protein